MSDKPNRITVKSSADALQGRDTIYIDTDDDITSIIEKVKASANAVVALVPPARIGVLQSVVNLKLLQRAVKSHRKKLSLITNDRALTSLAAALKIPVAKNVSAQAEIPVVAADVEAPLDDVIDGSELAVGELAALSDKPARTVDKSEDKEISAAVAAIETDDKIKNDLDADGEPDDGAATPERPVRSKKVPNFNAFRKKLFIFGGLGVLAAAFLVWAIVFAPHGVITIKAKTTAADISATVALVPSAATDISKNIIQPVVKQVKKSETMNFTATGQKDVGTKATGEINVYNNYSASTVTLAAGTTLAKGSYQFTLDAAVTIPGCQNGTFSHGVMTCGADIADAGSITAKVTATQNGEDYNLAADTNLAVSGQSSKIYAVAKGDFTGGSSKTATVVQQSDIDAAVQKIKDNVGDGSATKKDLVGQLGGDVTPIDGSFAVSYGAPSSSPAVDQEAPGGATVTMEVTYTVLGIATADLNNFLNNQANLAMDAGAQQKIYDNGLKKLQLKDFAANGNQYSVALKTTAQVGPQLNETAIKQESVGKRSGEISETLNKIAGVDDVQVSWSPFWVTSVSSADRLKVNFTVSE